jgi:hypothetical protein
MLFQIGIDERLAGNSGAFSFEVLNKIKDPHPPFAYAHSSLSRREREKMKALSLGERARKANT